MKIFKTSNAIIRNSNEYYIDVHVSLYRNGILFSVTWHPFSEKEHHQNYFLPKAIPFGVNRNELTHLKKDYLADSYADEKLHSLSLHTDFLRVGIPDAVEIVPLSMAPNRAQMGCKDILIELRYKTDNPRTVFSLPYKIVEGEFGAVALRGEGGFEQMYSNSPDKDENGLPYFDVKHRNVIVLEK